MSRPIKFRAWDGANRQMVDSPNLAVRFDGPIVHLAAPETSPWDHLELMQFTGLTDKNGVEIYEGDLLKPVPVFNGDKPLVVEFLDNGFWCDVPSGKCVPVEHLREVIGNIYENPELLK